MTSPSGNLHGMPLGFMLNIDDWSPHKTLPGFEWLRPPYLKPHQIAFIGLRDVDDGERAYVI